MASSRRIERINGVLREVVAGILSRDLSFPEGVMVTVTRVEASEDLYYANIFVSVFGGTKDQGKNILGQLSGSAGMIQRRLNRSLRMRPVPKITFQLDENEVRRERIEKLLGDNISQQN